MESTDKSSPTTKTNDDDWYIDCTDDPNEPGGFEFIGGIPPKSVRDRIYAAHQKKKESK